MATIELLLLLALSVTGYFALGRRQLPARAGPSPLALDALAEHLALPAPSRGATRLTGKIHGFSLTVEGHSDAAHIHLDTHGAVPAWLRITPRTRYAPTDDDALRTTGDPYLDARFAVCGSENELAALMDVPTRQTLARVLGAQVQDGTFHFRTTAHNPRSLEMAIDRIVELARTFADPNRSSLDRVYASALDDTHPQVRRRLLELIVRDFSTEERTGEILTRALEDPYVRNAFFAARALDNEDGRTFLKRFVIVGERNEERIAAFEDLLEHEPWDELSPLLETAALGSSREMARRATEWLLEQGTPVVFTRLLDRLTPSTPHADLVVAAAVRAGGSELERSLIALLQRSHGDTAAATTMTFALEALETIGTAKSAPWLQTVASGADPAFAAPRRAAKKALTAIRERGRANAGALTLLEADAEAGALSVAEAGTGSMSLAEPEDAADLDPPEL